jgi:hypothetical protein
VKAFSLRYRSDNVSRLGKQFSANQKILIVLGLQSSNKRFVRIKRIYAFFELKM